METEKQDFKEKFEKDEDFVLYKKDGKIMSGGFDVQSILLKNGISPIVTQNFNYETKQYDNVSDLFKNLIIPSGLFYVQKQSLRDNHGYNYDEDISTSIDTGKDADKYDEEVIDDDLYEKLLEFSSADKKPSKFKKTRKNNTKINNKKDDNNDDQEKKLKKRNKKTRKQNN